MREKCVILYHKICNSLPFCGRSLHSTYLTPQLNGPSEFNGAGRGAGHTEINRRFVGFVGLFGFIGLVGLIGPVKYVSLLLAQISRAEGWLAQLNTLRCHWREFHPGTIFWSYGTGGLKVCWVHCVYSEALR